MRGACFLLAGRDRFREFDTSSEASLVRLPKLSQPSIHLLTLKRATAPARAAPVRARARHTRPLVQLELTTFVTFAHLSLFRACAPAHAGAALVAGCVAEEIRLQQTADCIRAQIGEMVLELVGLVTEQRPKQPMPSAAHGQVGSGAHVLAHRCRSRDASCALSCPPLLSAVGPVAVLRARGTFLLCVWSVCDYVVA